MLLVARLTFSFSSRPLVRVDAFILLPMRCPDFQGDIDNHNHRNVPLHRLQAGPQLCRGLRTFCENVEEGEVRFYLTKFSLFYCGLWACDRNQLQKNIFQHEKSIQVSFCCTSHLTFHPALPHRCPAWVMSSISLTVYETWLNLEGGRGDSGKVRKMLGKQFWFCAPQSISVFRIELLTLQEAKSA